MVALAALALTLGVAACGGSSSSSSTESSEEGGEAAGTIQSNPANGKVSLTIGSKNFPEQEILGEIYAQALTAAGYKVKSALNLGSETVALKAVKTEQISGYPSTRAPRSRPSSDSNRKKSPPTRPKPGKRPTRNSKRKGSRHSPRRRSPAPTRSAR
jgi:ABC-type proline/glycine betaine transport system substrate-binding protein